MRKKIVIGLSLFSLIFFLGGIYIIIAIEKTTSDLDKLIVLHQVEILREHLLIQIKRVQSDLSLKSTHHARGFATFITDVRNMGEAANTCFDCHHTESVQKKLNDLRDHNEKYKGALSRVLTIRANVSRLEAEEDNAFRIGEELITKVNSMITITSSKLEEKTKYALNKIANTKIILFVLIAVGPLITTGLAFVFIKGFTKPMNELLDATRKLKEGNLDYRVKKLKDEFGELAASFNEMAGSLKKQMHEMQRAEQMVVIGELAAGLAHEIKNPLAGIKVSMEVLSEEPTIQEDDKAVLSKVVDEVKRIELLLSELLSFAKPPKPQFMSLDVNDILNKAVDFSMKNSSLSPNKPKPINISYDFDDNLPSIMADSMQLQQVFLNLLLNAKDAMRDGGTLTVRTFYERITNLIQIEISDTGKGINDGIMDKIFYPFFTTKPKGTGLGLAIVKQLIEQHGGTVLATKNPGGGATFKISLPVRQAKG